VLVPKTWLLPRLQIAVFATAFGSISALLNHPIWNALLSDGAKLIIEAVPPWTPFPPAGALRSNFPNLKTYVGGRANFSKDFHV
jgi:hypothetical protein